MDSLVSSSLEPCEQLDQAGIYGATTGYCTFIAR